MYLSAGAPIHVARFTSELRLSLSLLFAIVRHWGTRVSPLGPGDSPERPWDQVNPILGPDDKFFPLSSYHVVLAD
jgi:hypothetical protein